MKEEHIQGYLDQMVEVEELNDDQFLIVKETLTRIGVASLYNMTLTQSCHILHKRGKYYVTHFKLLLALDGRVTNFDEKDKARQNTIAGLLDQWGLIKIKDKSKMKDFVSVKSIKIISSQEKEEWSLVSKHRLGR